MTEQLTKLRIPKKKIPTVDKVDRKKLKQVRIEQLPVFENVGGGTVAILENVETGKIYIERVIDRNKIRNLLDQYEQIEGESLEGTIKFMPLTAERANEIVDRVISNRMSFNSCFVFGTFRYEKVDMTKSDAEHKFTSTGVKFWRHQQQMFEFKKPIDGSPRHTVISTHVSPEGHCNLACNYCSVTYRDTHSRIELPRIKQYVSDLKKRGLKAVILTGGGEPTLYPQFNELVQWIKRDQGLNVALITNGTTSDRIDPETLTCFSWVRISVNVFPGWEEKIDLRTEHLDPDCVVGASMVFTVEHHARDTSSDDRAGLFRSVAKIADRIGARYVRLLPNVLLTGDRLQMEHAELKKLLDELNDPRFFHQHKVHGTPGCSTCHQAYFRPYLSEEKSKFDSKPGSVYPCDSVVLNDSLTHFAQKFQVCKPEDVLDFIDGKIAQEFNPQTDCSGCVFAHNIAALDDYLVRDVQRFDEFSSPLLHEEFV